MSDVVTLGVAWVAGVVLGGLFFGGLWWTVRRALNSARPARWFLGSLVVRMSLVLAGLYLMAGHDWRSLAAGLLGIVMARVAVTFVVGRHVPPGPAAGEVTGHAP